MMKINDINQPFLYNTISILALIEKRLESNYQLDTQTMAAM